jgi:hypothetical protein
MFSGIQQRTFNRATAQWARGSENTVRRHQQSGTISRAAHSRNLSEIEKWHDGLGEAQRRKLTDAPAERGIARKAESKGRLCTPTKGS